MIGPMEKQISPNVWQVGTFEFTQYLVGNPPAILMEGGISLQSLLILHQLETLGLSSREIRYLGILHSHFDHLGTFPLLREKAPMAKVIAGEKNIETLSRPRVLKRMLASSKAVTAIAREIGFLPEIYDIPELGPIPVDIPLKDGDTLKISSLTFTFVSLPGHSPDAMGAYLSNDGIFFCSDMAGFNSSNGSNRPNYYFCLKDYENSLEKIYSFDIETLCFGHNGTLTGHNDVKRFLERTIDHTNKLKKQIKDWFESGRDLEKLAQQFANSSRKGFLALFPYEHMLLLSHLLIRRTLEYYGLSSEEG